MKTDEEIKHSCSTCGKNFSRKDVLKTHQKMHQEVRKRGRMDVDPPEECKEFFEVAALKGILKKFVFNAGKEKDPMVLLGNRKDKVVDRLRKRKCEVVPICAGIL